MWNSVVEVFELAIYLAGQSLGGSLAAGVFAVAATTRLLTLPLSYHIARSARRRAAQISGIQDQVAELKRAWADDPRRLLEETRALYASRGLKLLDASSMRLAVLQMPVVLALFHAVRRVIAGSSLATASLPIALLASAVSSVAILSNNHSSSGAVLAALVLVAGVAAGALALTLGSGFGIYSVAFQGVSTLQGLMLRRRERLLLPR